MSDTSKAEVPDKTISLHNRAVRRYNILLMAAPENIIYLTFVILEAIGKVSWEKPRFFIIDVPVKGRILGEIQ